MESPASTRVEGKRGVFQLDRKGKPKAEGLRNGSAAASAWGPSGWRHSEREHREVLTIPLDLHKTGWMLLKLKKFVNARVTRTTGSRCGENQRGGLTDRFCRDGAEKKRDSRELACAVEVW